MLTEGDTFTDLDGHVGLVDVLIDSQLKKMYFGYVTGKSRSFQYYLSVLFIYFTFIEDKCDAFYPSNKAAGQCCDAPETSVKSTYTKQTASGYIFQNKTSFSLRATQLRTRLQKKGYEL